MKLSNETTTNLNKSLLIKLYKTSQKSEIHPSFKAKLALRSRHYPELEIFKIRLEEEQIDLHPHLYSEAKNKLLKYRLVFFSFFFLFSLLTGFIHLLNISWSYSFLFENTVNAKWSISSFTGLMALAAFACAYLPSSLHEATRFVVSKAEKSLQNIYRKKRVMNGLGTFFNWGEQAHKSNVLRHMYQELVEKLNERGERTYRLLKKITQTPSLSTQKREHLYNQALAELHDKLCFSIHRFKQLEFEPLVRQQIS